jgi:hypothetical protein
MFMVSTRSCGPPAAPAGSGPPKPRGSTKPASTMVIRAAAPATHHCRVSNAKVTGTSVASSAYGVKASSGISGQPPVGPTIRSTVHAAPGRASSAAMTV